MATSSLLRWGLLLLSAAVVALAVALGLQQPLTGFSPTSSSTSSTATTTTQYCYRDVRTHDQEKPSARCFSVVDGLFGRVLSEDEAASDTPPADAAVVVEDPGYVMPGLWDGHGHLLQYGEFLHSVDLFGSESLDDVRARIKAYLDANPGAGTRDQWVRGVGWDQTAFGRMPTAADVDQDPQLRGVYMMLDRIDVHCSWVSQPVLDLLPDLPEEVPGGEIVRDPGMGVFCDNAMDLVAAIWPKPTPDIKARQVKSAMAALNEVGLAGMVDAGATPTNLHLYGQLSASDDWTVRVHAMVECDKRNTFCPEAAAAVATTEDDNIVDATRFIVRSVKLFADGALGSWGSAMIEPYTDHPWTSGSLLINATELTRVATAWAAEGYQVNIHAIGDLANRYAIDALEAALEQQCPPSAEEGEEEKADRLRRCQAAHRFRIEHAQIIHPDDQARILRLGIIPSIQPTHATSDFKYAESRLGTDRLRSSAYRMRSLSPAHPVLGSDFPVEPPDPFQGIYAAVTRRSPHTGLGPDGGSAPDDGFLVEETLSLDDALWGFTGAPAYGSFLEGKAGVIREGAFADWVVLDAPIDEVDIEDLRNFKVRETWVGGRRVYTRPN